MKGGKGIIIFTILFLISLSFCLEKNEEKFKEVYRVKVSSLDKTSLKSFQNFLSKYEELHLIDMWRVSGEYYDIAVTDISKVLMIDYLERNEIEFELFVPSLPSLLSSFREQQESALKKGEEAKENEEGFFLAYRNTTEIITFLQDLMTKYPSLISLSIIGYTYEGREIIAATISADVQNSFSKPGMVYIGCQHAREWVSPMVVTYIAEMLCANYAAGDQTTVEMLSSFQYTLIPVVNADGYNYSITDDRLWRKNRRINEGSPCVGVDLNRNWDYEWGGEGSSGVMCVDTYRGSSPFSEPETLAVSNYILQKQNLIGFIDFHAYGQYFMNPWGWTDSQVPVDNPTQIAMAEQFAAAVKDVHNKGYTTGNSAIVLYPAAGGSDDWTYGAMNIIYSYTLELRDTGRYGFLLPPDEIIPNGEEIWAGVQTMAQYILSY